MAEIFLVLALACVAAWCFVQDYGEDDSLARGLKDKKRPKF